MDDFNAIGKMGFKASCVELLTGALKSPQRKCLLKGNVLYSGHFL
jgi:hypothetical protein